MMKHEPQQFRNLAIATRSALGALVIAFATSSALAGTITVTNTNNNLAGSLRQAINDATPGDTIVFNIPTSDPGYNGTTGVFTINLTTAELTIGKDLTITGGNARIVVQRSTNRDAPDIGVFNVTAGNVTIADLTIANGHSGAGGGGVRNTGNLILHNCTLRDNSAGSFPGGGALLNGNGGVAVVRNCTLVSNIYQAVWNQPAGTITLESCTVVKNGSGTVDSGGLYNQSGGTFRVRNSVVAGNLGGYQDAKGSFISEGHNFIGAADGGAGFNSTGDQVGTGASRADPKLGSLQYNGGSTATITPNIGSPLIDQGRSGSTVIDQRGLPRPIDHSSIANAVGGDGADIGAVESDVQAGSHFVVNTLSGHADGVCSVSDCSLADAVDAANANADANIVSFAPGLSGTIVNSVPQGLTILHDVTINGPGARNLTISGNNVARLFNVPTRFAKLSIGGLTLANGRAGGTSYPGNRAGAILNLGKISLVNCALVNNSSASHGGAIYSIPEVNDGFANVALQGCTFSQNSAGGSGGAIFNGGYGGAAFVYAVNCTFYGNRAAEIGGATYNDGTLNGNADLTLVDCTFAENTSSSGIASGIYNDASNPDSSGFARVKLLNTILRNGPSGVNLLNDSGIIVSNGYNISSDRAGGSAGTTEPGGFLNGPGDRRNTDPLLGSLQNNGGPTDTVALLANSPAIDAGINPEDNAEAQVADQRGYFRAGANDIGAFELNGLPPVAPTVTTGPATDIGMNSATLNATVNPNGFATTYRFTSNFGSFEVQDAGSGSAPVAISAAVTGLSPGTQYRFNVTAMNAYGTTEGVEQTFTTSAPPPPPPPTRFANISTRLRVGTGDNAMFGGFIVTGSAQKRIVVRAIGPSLDLEDKLANPVLELYDGSGNLLETNDNWREAPNAQEIIDSAIAPPNELESAILRNVEPGLHSALVRDAAGGEGAGLVEIYDLGSAQDSKLANIATRGHVLTGTDIMIGGLIVTGSNPQKVIVRAIGPSLGIAGQLEDPVLELIDRNGELMAANNNWRDTQEAEITETTIPPSHELESAIVAFLPPDLYTAQLRGVDDGTGVALVEVYALQ